MPHFERSESPPLPPMRERYRELAEHRNTLLYELNRNWESADMAWIETKIQEYVGCLRSIVLFNESRTREEASRGINLHQSDLDWHSLVASLVPSEPLAEGPSEAYAAYLEGRRIRRGEVAGEARPVDAPLSPFRPGPRR